MSASSSMRRFLRNRKAVAATVAAVVVLAVAISLFAAFAPTNEPDLPQVTPAAESQDLYTQALAADASGSTTEAVALLQRAVVVDPTNTGAKKKIVEIKQRQKPSEPATKTTPGSTDRFLGSVGDLKKLLPKNLEGYSIGGVNAVGPEATVSGQPQDLTLGVSKVVWAIHEQKDAKTAQTFAAKVSKPLYGKDQATVDVDGIEAYFGTNGTSFATVSYVRGRYVFEVVLSTDGTPPVDYKAQVIAAAKAFPDSF